MQQCEDWIWRERERENQNQNQNQKSIETVQEKGNEGLSQGSYSGKGKKRPTKKSVKQIQHTGFQQGIV